MTEQKRGRGRPRIIPITIPKYKKGDLQRPNVWICGTDEYRHSMYNPWLKRKAQANFRKEKWELTFDEFFDLWNGKWEFRGRQAHHVCMSRKDETGPWSVENTYIISRYDQLCINAAKRREQGERLKAQGLPSGYKKREV